MPDQPVTEPQDRQEEEQGARSSQRTGVRQDAVAGAPAVDGLAAAPRGPREAIFGLDEVQVSYGPKPAVRGVSFDIGKNEITALIAVGLRQVDPDPLPQPHERPDPGRTGGGQGALPRPGPSTPPRSTSRCASASAWSSRSPTCFPKSIYDNIAFGPRVLGMKGDMDEIVERQLTQGALWDEVKDRLKTNAFGMSGGQQQRLCIARCLAVNPDVILMDEPLLGARPDLHGKIEDLMMELKQDYSIVIVTHNMQQAARVSDKTAFFTAELDDEEHRSGRVVEFDDTEKIFTNPADSRTEAYVTGKVGKWRTCPTAQLAAISKKSSRSSRSRRSAASTWSSTRRPRARDGAAARRRAGQHGDRGRRSHRRVATSRCTRACSLLARQAPVAGDLRLGGAAPHHEEHRAHGRPVREHMASSCRWPATSRRRTSGSWPTSSRWASRRSQVVQCKQVLELRARHRSRPGPGAPGRPDRPPEPRCVPPRARDRRRRRHARVGDA